MVRPSPFVEHRLPVPGSFVTLPDGSLGKLGLVPRGLIVAREPRDLPENAPQWPPTPGLKQKGKHPAELPGMLDVQVVERAGAVLWPPHECSVPVCAIMAADSTRLRKWHAIWDSYVDSRTQSADELAQEIEALLERGKKIGGKGSGVAAGSPLSGGKESDANGTTAANGTGDGGKAPTLKDVLRELTETYGRLEEQQRHLLELEAPGIDEERLATLQRGIQRFAALARFG